MDSYPKFAVVGHPNKGKSSIVSALAMDDTVQISDIPGTTTKRRSFPLKVDGKILYELIDTPGFQRARQVLGWLQNHEVRADKRVEVVEAFINTHRNDPKYNDEIELLEPLMEGAGIIYVVDASKPYGVEYEAEMEILRWTGQPSMALVNHIDDADYSDEWKRALSQYFKIVRTYNPMKNDMHQHISILESMAQLKEEWITPIKASITLFERYKDQKLQQSAQLITRLIVETLTHIETLDLNEDEVTDSQKTLIEKHYKQRLRGFEEETQHKIEAIWHHTHLEKEQTLLTFEGLDLFSQEAASVFGLTKKELVITGVTSGAVTGAGIDLLFAGHTLLLGGIVGGVVGGAGAYFGFDELSEIKVLGQTLGRHMLQMGPMKNRNFPYILLGRALYHTLNIAQFSHANREVLDIQMDERFKEKWLDERLQKSLEAYHKRYRRNETIESEDLEGYERLVKRILEHLIGQY